jgi:hypothetical protein
MPSVIFGKCRKIGFYVECHYAECRYAECHYAECRYAECHYAECRYGECHYAECRYAECVGAFGTTDFGAPTLN